jgi:predicted small lipoprotein YifL
MSFRSCLRLLALSLLISLQACGRKEEAPPVPPAAVAEIERQRERADREQKAKEEERKKREDAEQKAASRETTIWMVVIGGLVFTLVGIAIGSAAKKQAAQSRKND